MKWWEKIPLLMTDDQFRLLYISAGSFLAAQVGVWLGYGLFLYLTGRV